MSSKSPKCRKRSTSRSRKPKWPSYRHQSHVENLITAQTKFAWQLYKAISAHPNLHSSLNVCFSPVLVHQALTMSFIGARYESAELLRSVLHLDKMENDAAINLAFGDVTRYLTHSSTSTNIDMDEIEQPEQQLYTLYPAIRLYLPITHCLLDQYGTALFTFYGSDIAKVPFHTDKERARQEINQWVEETTQQKIKTLVPPLGLATFVSMVLASALYFKPSWSKKTQAAGKMILMNFNDVQDVLAFKIKTQLRYGTIDEADCRIVEIPFADEKHSLILILSNQAGSDAFEVMQSKLNDDILNRLDSYFLAIKAKLRVTFPHFEVCESLPLGKVLQHDQNISRIFARGKANFSGISGNNNLHLSHVEHKIRFELDEFKQKQLQAKKKRAASPSNKIEQNSNGKEIKTTVKMDKSRMDFDRPFIFIVKDNGLFNGSLLFGSIRHLPPFNPDALNGTTNNETKACTC